MGKAKKRNFHNCAKTAGMPQGFPAGVSRSEAIEEIREKLKSNSVDETVKNYIGLFGITAEELAEAGISYEALVVLKPYWL